MGLTKRFIISLITLRGRRTTHAYSLLPLPLSHSYYFILSLFHSLSVTFSPSLPLSRFSYLSHSHSFTLITHFPNYFIHALIIDFFFSLALSRLLLYESTKSPNQALFLSVAVSFAIFSAIFSFSPTRIARSAHLIG